MRYTTQAMDALRTARGNNPNVSQRRLAHNIVTITDLSRRFKGFQPPVIDSTRVLFVLLGRPTEFALAHLIRGIDRQVRKDTETAATVTNSETLNRKKIRLPDGRKSRARKTAGVGTRINTRGRKV